MTTKRARKSTTKALKALKPVPPQLPAKVSDLKLKPQVAPKPQDQIFPLWRKAFDTNEKFPPLFEAGWNSQAVHGSLTLDDAAAANILVKMADEEGIEELVSLKMSVFINKMHLVAKWHGVDRASRRQEAMAMLAAPPHANQE